MRSFFKIEEILRLLHDAGKGDPLVEQMLRPDGNRCTPDIFIRKTAGIRSEFSAEGALGLVADGLNEYLAGMPMPPARRQQYWEACRAWFRRLAAKLGLPESRLFEEQVPRPVELDTGIRLIHALHANEPKTKSELSRELGVTEKTIQTCLRALDPSLQEGGQRAAPMRLAGYAVQAHIEQTLSPRTDTEGRARRAYQMKERLHPIVLQLNTMQLGGLMRALQTLFDLEDCTAAREIALDVWCQLSEPARDRIGEVYGTRYDEFSAFLSELEEEKDRLPAFRTEEETYEDLTQYENLEYAFKGSRVCSFRIVRDNQPIQLRRVRLEFGGEDSESWLAIPADEYPDRKNAFAFRRSELRGYLEFPEET